MEFDPRRWIADLAQCVQIELRHWGVRLTQDTLRPVALQTDDVRAVFSWDDTPKGRLNE